MTMVSPDPERHATPAPCVPLRAVLCDAVGTLVADMTRPAPGADVVAALARLRRADLRIGVVHDGAAAPAALRAVLGRLDVVLAACLGPRRVPGVDELGPRFVERVCVRLGFEPAACAVVGGRRPLLAAAAWVGARTFMVAADDTPAFQFRAMREVVADLPTAVDELLDGCLP